LAKVSGTDFDTEWSTLTAGSVGAVSLINGKADPAQISAPIVTLTGSATLALSHAGCVVEINSLSAVTITIPTDAAVAFPIGTEIELLQEGEGAVTISPAGGVMLNSFETKRRIAGWYAVAVLKKRGVNDWRLAGNLA
jgi:hypothetical protein